MITIHSAMLLLLGFSLAALACLLLAPFYRRRVERLATDALKRSIPLTSAEIRADKDRLRAEFAITIHKLESKVEQAKLAAARQLVEINRRDALISALEGDAARMRTGLEEHENARRVLEQTIVERLPKVEQRLASAKELLSQRDKQIAELSGTATRHAAALEEATQINAQQRDEIHRLNAAMTTHAARSRESLRDAGFDAEVALRAELETLRAKTRDQAALISRLQTQIKAAGAAQPSPQVAGQAAGQAASAVPPAEAGAGSAPSAQGAASAAPSVEATAFEQQLRSLQSRIRDQAAEIANLNAKLKAYEDGAADERGIRESKIALKARLSALQAQADEQSATIQTLRAEIAAANEKMARQANHFMEEMRRLGAGTQPVTGPARRTSTEPPRRASLSERINAPRTPRAVEGVSETSEAGRELSLAEQMAEGARPATFLRAVEGAGAETTTATETGAPEPVEAPQPKARRPGLLERITGLEKQA